jgi:hypothetical protein
MKLKHFNMGNVESGHRNYIPTIRLNSKTGLITFNVSVSSNLGLKEGSKIEFIQDEDSPVDWYVVADKDIENAFICRKAKAGSGMFISSVFLVKEIFESCKIQETSVKILVSKFPIIKEGLRLFALITKSYKK